MEIYCTRMELYKPFSIKYLAMLQYNYVMEISYRMTVGMTSLAKSTLSIARA